MTPQSVDLVGCSASNFADSAESISRSREIQSRIADQANKLISHFYGLGAYLSPSNFLGAASTHGENYASQRGLWSDPHKGLEKFR
jgi:hypothetical protein